MIHHITIDGVPYCECECQHFSISLPGRAGIPYPANCGHATKADAEEGKGAILNAFANLLDLPHDVQVVPGPCHDDPYWIDNPPYDDDEDAIDAD